MRILTPLVLSACAVFAQTAMFHNCPPEGTWKTEEDKALNTLKNRWTAPDPINKQVDLAEVVAPGPDEHRFGNGWGATLEGYIVALKLEGPEGCNCESPAPDERDFHIWFGLKPSALKRECMVIEITPRWREAKKWDVSEIKSWKSRRVRVTGWFFWDPRHASMAVNSTPSAKLLARATCWELHPVTSVEVLP